MIQGLTYFVALQLLWGLLFLVFFVLLVSSEGRSRAIRRRSFWCPLSRRQVEVEFDERGLPGFRRQVAVRSCSVFDPSTAVTCGRRCTDVGFRRQWALPLPVRGPQ